MTAKIGDNNFGVKENATDENSKRIYILSGGTEKISETEYWDNFPEYENTGKRIHIETGNEYDNDGYNKDGYNKDGYDKKGLNYQGYDKDGYDEYGFDQFDFNRDGINKDTGTNKDSEGHTREFYNS